MTFVIYRHAGVYTAEEVALITMDKLIRLQSLYINQFKRLQHVMKEKRRKYLKAVKQEQDTIGMSTRNQLRGFIKITLHSTSPHGKSTTGFSPMVPRILYYFVLPSWLDTTYWLPL